MMKCPSPPPASSVSSYVEPFVTDSFHSYLANDMEEDNQAPKQDIFYFLYGKSYAQRPMFHKLRFQFIRSMGWRIWVSQEECEEVWRVKGNVGAGREEWG